MDNEYKKLVKSSNRVICGVCGGIGEYFKVDPTVIRILFVIFGFWGPALVGYIIAAIIMPEM